MGCMALVSTGTECWRLSASPSMAMISGFMKGLPPVKPTFPCGQPVTRNLVEKGDDLGSGDIGEPIVLRARVD
jgi:hypothetical protein